MKAHTGKDWFWYQMGPQERSKARDLIHFSHGLSVKSGLKITIC